ncbi:MAG: hypothetical protein M3R58_15505, partial [Pseudomonadota bacterium]|nr:hypothetical protein [Pseudomonadota bacterium]
MTPEIEALRSNRTVVVSVITAAISITVLCLVGIAAMLGWVGGPRAPIAPVIVSVPAKTVSPRTATPVPAAAALIPGETLVTPTETPASKAASPPASPVAQPASKPAAPPPPRTRTEPAPRPRPANPTYARPGESQAPRPPRKLVCRTCGTVTAIATFPDLWEVRVRLEDGASFSVR